MALFFGDQSISGLTQGTYYFSSRSTVAHATVQRFNLSSLSPFLTRLPRSFLSLKGFKFTDKSRFDPYAAPTDIGYLFAYSQGKLVDWVLSKKAAAGAFSDDDFARLEAHKRSDIVILARTQPLPRHFISVRKDFAPALVERLENVLLAMHENDQGRQILKKTDDTTKFDRLPEGEAGLRRRLRGNISAQRKETSPTARIARIDDRRA